MKDDKLYLIRISEYIQRIELYTRNGRDAFMQSLMIQDAVIRNFENIGESAKRISQELKQLYPDIPWRRIAGFRDILAHNYLNVDIDEVWNVVKRDLLALKIEIESILKELDV